jgi:hypothetical protein
MAFIDGPNDAIRSAVYEGASGIDSEDQLDALLETLEYQIASSSAEDYQILQGYSDRPPDEDEATALLAAVDAWASLASHAVAQFYAPASPWPGRGFEGWSKRVVERLRKIASMLRGALEVAVRALNAVGFSIGVSFPWGISISVGW